MQVKSPQTTAVGLIPQNLASVCCSRWWTNCFWFPKENLSLTWSSWSPSWWHCTTVGLTMVPYICRSVNSWAQRSGCVVKASGMTIQAIVCEWMRFAEVHQRIFHVSYWKHDCCALTVWLVLPAATNGRCAINLSRSTAWRMSSFENLKLPVKKIL